MKEKFYVKTEREDNFGKVCAAVRPECGYLEFYLNSTDKLR